MELLRYVDYIKYERVNIQSFMSGFPSSYKDRINFLNLQTLDETIRMAMHCYEQGKGKDEVQPTWKEKTRDRFEQRGKLKPRKKEFR